MGLTCFGRLRFCLVDTNKLVLLFPTTLLHLQVLVLAGLGAGLTEAIVITPFERIKVHLQAQRSKLSEVHVYVVYMYTTFNILP